jgi:3-hydroxybutyryl-CoA dehydrogenase
VFDTAKAWGKAPVYAKSTPGFIANRIARPFYGEALKLLEEGAADVATIDAIMKDCGGFRMGPFELMDLIGNDINFAATESLYRSFFEDPRFRPSPIQQRMVMGGNLGRKSGRGFYSYDKK